MAEQNKRLKQEKERLDNDNKAPLAQSLHRIPESIALEEQKKAYETRNKELEQLIQQVIQGHKEPESKELS